MLRLFVFILLPLAAVAAPLTPDRAVALALAGNPELRAARHLITEAEARRGVSGRLANPELESELAGGPEGEGRVSVGLTQRFPLTGRLRLERQRSALDVEIAGCEVAERERQLALEVRTAVLELAAARSREALNQRRRAAVGTFAEATRAAVAQGSASPLETGEAARAARELTRAEGDNAAAIADWTGRLATLLGVRTDALPSPVDLPPPPAAAPASRPLRDRPDLRLAELAVQAGADDVALARATRWDDVGIGVFVEGERLRDEPDGLEPEAFAGIRVSVPLPFWQDGNAAVAEKRAAAARRADELAALRLAAQNAAISAHRGMAARHRTARAAAATDVPVARRHLADVEAAAARGEADVAAVFAARERLLDAEGAALDAGLAYHLAHAQWLFTLGAP